MMVNGKTFQKQYRKCCRTCTHGQAGVGHGPYWYSSGTGEPLRYVGKELPAQVQDHLELVAANEAELEKRSFELGKQAGELWVKARHVDDLRRAVDCVRFGGHQDQKLLEELELSEYVCLV
jgi:hypothetical protein